MNEIFKDIPEYEGLYRISDLGRVKSLPKEWVAGTGGVRSHNGKFLKLVVGGNGYLCVGLSCEGKRKTKTVHQLVAIVHLNHKPDGNNGLIVDHVNNNPLDNRLDNLQLITNRENSSKDRVGGSSQYVGVYWDKRGKKWRAYIRINKKLKYLGLFKDELDAANKYRETLNELKTNII